MHPTTVSEQGMILNLLRFENIKFDMPKKVFFQRFTKVDGVGVKIVKIIRFILSCNSQNRVFRPYLKMSLAIILRNFKNNKIFFFFIGLGRQ